MLIYSCKFLKFWCGFYKPWSTFQALFFVILISTVAKIMKVSKFSSKMWARWAVQKITLSNFFKMK
jgi:hypothetical protein